MHLFPELSIVINLLCVVMNLFVYMYLENKLEINLYAARFSFISLMISIFMTCSYFS